MASQLKNPIPVLGPTWLPTVRGRRWGMEGLALLCIYCQLGTPNPGPGEALGEDTVSYRIEKSDTAIVKSLVDDLRKK